jgi:hypothetical protein
LRVARIGTVSRAGHLSALRLQFDDKADRSLYRELCGADQRVGSMRTDAALALRASRIAERCCSDESTPKERDRD